MLNKKDNLIIFVLTLLVMSLAVFVVVREINDENVNKNQNINTNKITDNNINQNKNINSNVNQPEKIDYSGKITKEANGWKKYRNEYWGIEFRFRDEKDVIINNDMSNGIIIRHHKKGPYINPYIYIDFNDYSGKEYSNLKKYLERGNWNYLDIFSDLIYIKKITNKNELEFIEVLSEYMSGRQSQKPLVYSKSRDYYIEYNKKNIREDEKFRRQSENTKDFIAIHDASDEILGQTLQQQILDTFKFID